MEERQKIILFFSYDLFGTLKKKEKKKRLGHCYDAIYTVLYLLLSPNNLLRQKKKDI